MVILSLCFDYMMVAKNDAFKENMPTIESYLDTPRKTALLDKVCNDLIKEDCEHYEVYHTF